MRRKDRADPVRGQHCAFERDASHTSLRLLHAHGSMRAAAHGLMYGLRSSARPLEAMQRLEGLLASPTEGFHVDLTRAVQPRAPPFLPPFLQPLRGPTREGAESRLCPCQPGRHERMPPGLRRAGAGVHRSKSGQHLAGRLLASPLQAVHWLRET
jgi:hypothetical protein